MQITDLNLHDTHTTCHHLIQLKRRYSPKLHDLWSFAMETIVCLQLSLEHKT